MCLCAGAGIRGGLPTRVNGMGLLSGVKARPHYDVGTRGLIIYNFSIVDHPSQTASEKPCEILLRDVQWKLVFGTQTKLGEGGTNRLARLSQTWEAV